MREEDSDNPNAAQKASDLKYEIEKLDSMINDLKVLYEQYFLGIYTIAPDKQHNAVKAFIRKIRKAPFKTSATAYHLRAVEMRYGTLNTYWQRVLREREEGTYSRDVFKANVRERNALEDAKAETKKGAAERQMKALYDSYRDALEKQTGTKQKIDFDAFQKSLVQRAKDFKEKHGAKKLAFKVVVKEGKVSVLATTKE